MKQFLRSLFSLSVLLSIAHYAVAQRTCSISSDCCPETAVTTTPVTADCIKTCATGGPCFKNYNGCNPLRTTLHFRSQGANTARELVGWQWDINRPSCENYGAAYVAFEYQRSFRTSDIAKALFGGCTLTFAGSLVPDRPANALIADNFGLSREFLGSITFGPRIENYIVDLGFYIGLDTWLPGLYIRLHAPIVHTRWTLNASCNNCDIQCGTPANGFAPCYVGSTPNPLATGGNPATLPVTTEVTPNTFESAVLPVPSAPTIQQALSGNFLFGDMRTPWCAGKFSFCRRTRNGLADIDFILGYNWLDCDCYHFGAYMQAVLPTGPRRRDGFVFDPVVGNGGHFELGIGFTGHTVLWNGEDANLGIFLEGNVTHMFKNRQCRLFDFCANGPFSRYLLLKEFETNGTNFSYNGNIISATCFNNRQVNVSLAVKGDASVKLSYTWCGFGFDLGYNIYGHSQEKIRPYCEDQPCSLESRTFGIKGTEGVCCFNYPIADVTVTTGTETITVPAVFPAGATYDSYIGTPLFGGTVTAIAAPTGGIGAVPCPALGPVSIVTATPNNATQPTANACTVEPPLSAQIQNTDCGACLASNSATVLMPTAITALTPANGFYIASSIPPSPVKTGDLNLRSAQAPAVLTHKVFAYASYTWVDECGWNPQLGIGGEAEFASRSQRNDCPKGGLSQWGVLVKGVISF